MNDIWTIESDRLRLQVVRPGSEIYGRTRFNWNGFVNRITLDSSLPSPSSATRTAEPATARACAPSTSTRRPWPRRTLARSIRAWATAT